jgi:uncharacterized membrane protein
MFKHGNLLLTLVMVAACVGLSLLSLGPRPKMPDAPETRRVLARVTAVDNSQVRINLIIKTEEQFIKVRLLSGPYRGRVLDAVNFLTGKMEQDEFYRQGQLVLVEYDVRDGAPQDLRPRGVFRLHWQVLLVVLFAVLLLVLAGRTGFDALLSFLFTALLLWKVFFPLLLRGWPPLLTGLILTTLLTAVITLAVGGTNRRGFAAFIGAMLGVLLTCVLAVLFSKAFGLHGAIRPYAETLLYSGHINLDLTRIFVASVFIACSGAVMDLAMDVAAAMDEIHRQHPEISRLEHVRAGLRVGRAVIGTMTTTLLLAYSASHITMFMLFISRGMPLATIFNSPMVSAEILNTLVGSFGLIAAAPFTAIAAGFIYHRTSPPPIRG